MGSPNHPLLATPRSAIDRELAHRSWLGIGIYPLFWTLIVLSTNGLQTSWAKGAILLMSGLSLSRLLLVARFKAIYERAPEAWHIAFIIGALLAALQWGICASLGLRVLGSDWSSLTILICSAGLAAGASTS